MMREPAANDVSIFWPFLTDAEQMLAAFTVTWVSWLSRFTKGDLLFAP
jgi:hypothetical protein